ncbi:MAG TPA: thioredoxin-disulfide reductase [Ruminiclostridium sp.]|uniref:Thioredoxin reductase n=1 Tax=Acetivibrio saccincola TaxID=1677857 RepID=A0A2S8R6P5_9FIRM|nr:thioredoxin-disulfide reductase [Acetivibrio saccincola]PQQ65465.1 thioredoxin-disulfide reductase [Acetivibrio saccincola]HAA42497.1 thioredoxin-disulfide reductase [Ruminiclostridium sp.]
MKNGILYINAEDFEDVVLKSDLPVILYFYSDDCPPCYAFAPVFERTFERYSDKIKFVKIYRQHNRELAEKLNVMSSPTVLLFRDGKEVCSRLNGYISNPELRAGVENVIGGICSRKEREKVYCDVLILGGGPAGLSAAIYTARAKLFTVVVDEGLVGGQVASTFHVANYPGTNGVVRGIDLMDNMKKQAEDFGAIIDDMKEVSELNLEGEEKFVKTDDTDYYAKSVIIATGATPRKLPAEGEREFRGRGVHYCATCDGAMYQDANVIVVGGGNSAVEEAVFLTRYVKHVTLIHQLDHFQASKAAQEELFKNPNISIIWNSQVKKIIGENFVKAVLIENVNTKETQEIETDGVFVYIGMEPKTDFLKGKVKMNERGYIITDEDMQTNIPGVFAVGDVREKKVRQIATATGDGVVAGVIVEKYLAEKQLIFAGKA